ncbi:uncharacterized protein LOC130049139 [Ostrea edulis]|uniref:uncharacterized protein LOC130049139 n=1 Tax=Ostrea edulis TaxID=37623 RepID=UPI0024AFACA2|nr:uncharacterized protein LOC130049139 [Ostrea edulis]
MLNVNNLNIASEARNGVHVDSISMSAAKESACCTELSRVDEERESINKELVRITEHPGFSSVCLDEYELETAYYQYWSQYGEMRVTIEEQVNFFIDLINTKFT